MSLHNREFTRVLPKLEAVVAADAYHVSACETRDISMHGVFVVNNDTLPKGSSCEVTLYLSGSFDEIQIALNGKVVRTDNAGMAIEFDKVDLDSFEHLKKIILLNASDTDLVNTEFREHAGIRKKSDEV